MVETVRQPAWRLRWPLGSLLSGRAADAALAGASALVVTVPTVMLGGVQSISAPGWALMLVASAAVFFRHVYPLAATLVTLAATAVYLLMPDQDGPIVVTFAITIYTMMTLGRIVSGLMLGAVAVAAAFYGEYAGDGQNLGYLGLLFFVAWLITVMAVGGAVYNRRVYLREAEQRMRDAERSREQELLRHTMEERLRIAREVHDVLGHTISLVNVQAAAALHRMGKGQGDAGDTVDVLETIKDSSHEALRELRKTLGMLRQVDEDAPIDPAPSLDRVRELAARSERSGLTVHTEIEGEPNSGLPSAVELAGYRIVQEALTNVARHAGATSATVQVRYRADDVRLEVRDDGRGGDVNGVSGTGIAGMKERAAAVGGELSAGPHPDGGFMVCARLPFEPAARTTRESQ